MDEQAAATGDSHVTGVTGHVDTSGEPQTWARGQEGDAALPPGSPIEPHHHVDKSNEPQPATAGELRALGYTVDAEAPDDAIVYSYQSDLSPEAAAAAAEGPPPAEETSTEFDDDGEAPDEAAVPGDDADDDDEGADSAPESSSAEFQEGAAAARAHGDRKSPYDGRSRAGKDWMAGYDSVDQDQG